MKARKKLRRLFKFDVNKPAVRRPWRITRLFSTPTSNGDRSPPEPASDSATRPIMGVFTEEMLRLNGAAAKRHSVESCVHPDDFMYWFHVANPGHQSIEIPINYYFEDGGRSAYKLAEIVAAQGTEKGRQVSLLEFASGYGMVSRHIKKYPQLDFVSCDIHPAAVTFLSEQIGVKSLASTSVPEEFSPPDKYDVIFALSFFTHMPKSTFGRWISALYNTLNTPGYLIFTSHGSASLADVGNPELTADGFWFGPASEQKDLSVEEYGCTIAMPPFVMGEIWRQTGSKSVLYRHADWWTRQDLWIVGRTN